MAKKEYTFADEAKAIMRRFPRRETDPIEKQDYEQAMQQLVQMQEQVRNEMGLNNQQQEYKCGGNMKYANGGPAPLTGDNNNSYIKQAEPWYRQIPANINGWWSQNKPQLFKDFSITDPITPIVDYATGQGDGSLAIIPTPVGNLGAYPTAMSYLDDASAFARDASGITKNIVPGYRNVGTNFMDVGQNVSLRTGERIGPVSKKIIGLNKTPRKTLGPMRGSAAETYVPISQSTVTPSREALAVMGQKGKRTLLEAEDLAKQNKNIQQEFNKQFGKIGKGTTKIGSTNYSTSGGTPSNLQMINGKLYQIDPTTGVKIPWKNIGYGAAGTGILGAGIYGLTQLPDGTVVDGQGNIVNNNETLGANALQEWSPQGIGDIIDLSPNNSRAMDSDKGLTDINRLNSQIPQTTIPIKKGTASTTNVTVPTAKTATNQYNPTSRLVTNTAEIQPQSIPKLDREITPYEMKILGANEMNKIKNRTLDKSKQEQSWWDKNKQYAPYAISGLSNVAGNLLLANMAKKNRPGYTPVTSTPERINMEPYAEQLRKDAGVTKNVAMRNARNLGLNAGATLANMGAVGADVDRGLGANLANLYGQQEQYNVGASNQFNLANANAINQGRMFNTQVDLANKEAQLGYLSGALGTIPGVMKDIRMDKADKEMRSILDKYYTNMGGNYKNKGKSIWDDEAFQYMVANLPNDVRDKLLKKYSKEIGG